MRWAMPIQRVLHAREILQCILCHIVRCINPFCFHDVVNGLQYKIVHEKNSATSSHGVALLAYKYFRASSCTTQAASGSLVMIVYYCAYRTLGCYRGPSLVSKALWRMQSIMWVHIDGLLQYYTCTVQYIFAFVKHRESGGT